MAKPVEPRYLGDGVYASSSGVDIELTTGSHDNGTLVTLEPDVFVALVRLGIEAFGIDKALPMEIKRKFGPY